MFDLGVWLCGLVMLTVALVLSSALGLYQDYVYRQTTKKGEEKPFREAMFYSVKASNVFFQDLLLTQQNSTQ